MDARPPDRGTGILTRARPARARAGSLPQAEKLGIAAFGGDVLAARALRGEAQEVVRPTRLEPGAGQAPAAERMHPHHGADHVAVHVDVAGAGLFE